VALKTIEIYQRDKIMEHARRMGILFEERFSRLKDHPLVGEVRAKGLIGAVELVADKKTKRNFLPAQAVGATMVRHAQEHGLVCRTLPGDSVALCPPLIIQPDEINAMFDMFEKGLNDTEAWVSKENLRSP
jgi:4-aminobutyrate--pyruvate transaminase